MGLMDIINLRNYDVSNVCYTLFSENCIYVCQSASVDHQQALIEYSNSDGCFILQDLNSSHGTFVNNCRVQNAVVRLAVGDLIRFGDDESTYKFLADSSSQVIFFSICLLTGAMICLHAAS